MYKNLEERRKSEGKPEHGTLLLWKIERVELVWFLSHSGGTPFDGQYEPKMYGVPQIDNVHRQILGLFTSRTDKACLEELLSSKCFDGEAEKSVEEFLS